jgi:hypothetical protein
MFPNSDVSCDEQYSGNLPNRDFHDLLFPFLSDIDLDGTFAIDEPEEETCGVSEIVIADESFKKLRQLKTIVFKE